jgi:hypothetical protein
MPARTIASQIYPHLASVDPPPPPRAQPRLADALYPSLALKPPAPNRPRASPGVSLAQRCDESPAFEQRLALMGIIRRR